MPFVQRVIEPKYLSRTSLRDDDGKPKIKDEELQAVTNCTLSNALRQLASLVLLAEDIFSELTAQLQGVTERSKLAQTKIEKINVIVEKYDPKKVPVPEGSLSDFALRKVHYTASTAFGKELFTPETRPASLRNLYEKATTDRLSASILDQLRRDSLLSPHLLCTPVLSSKRRRIYQKVDVDIETRVPSVVEHLRKWTSKEAVGEVTALPDASMRISSGVTLTPDELSECSDDEPIDHRLPSPEEQLRVIAAKFSPELVAIDTSGKFFDRMCNSRKSLILVEAGAGETDTVKRRTRTRKPRDFRHSSADKFYLKKVPAKIARESPVVDLKHLNYKQSQFNTAHLHGRHGVVNYENNSNQQKGQSMFWTLPKRSILEPGVSPSSSNERQDFNINKLNKNIHLPPEPLKSSVGGNESIKISPIDPRTTGSFKSSTPSNKEHVVDLSSKLSPVKSTMTNEELYAVIHKSKKKLNIKDTAERADSPALSTASLSPVNSESYLYSKGSQRYPETGYIGDPRTRNSWAPERSNLSVNSLIRESIPQKQESTCADRYGPSTHTSRLDFKKLLLQHSVKLNTLNPQNKPNKLSAVEQLKLSKEKTHTPIVHAANKSQINILDLSGSPKTYSQRKIIKPNSLPSSPNRTSALIKEHKNTPKILLSPKSQWRFSSPRSDVLSTPILEVNNEDENSNSSGEKQEESPNNLTYKTVPIMTNQHFGARRNLIPINEIAMETEVETVKPFDEGVFPLNPNSPKSTGLTRAEIIQAKRAEFFNSPPEAIQTKMTSFTIPVAAGPSTNSQRKTSPEPGKVSPTTLETAL